MIRCFSFVFAILLFVSCQPVMMKLYGIKDPEIENEKTIKKSALKHGLDTTNIVTLNAENFLYVLNGRSIPDCSIYNSKGDYIEYRSSDTACNAGLFEFIPNLNTEGKYHLPDSLNLQGQMKKFLGLTGKKLKDPKPADFYILIYWTAWTGKLNRDHVKIWENLAKSNTNCKIEVIKVNLDLQEHWPSNSRDEIIQILDKKK